MAEVALKPRTAFDGLAVPGRYGARSPDEPQIIVTERPHLTVTQLSAFHGKSAEIAEAVSTETGLELPNGPKRVQAEGLSLIGVAPSQWLAIAEDEAARGRLSRLSAALAGRASVVDQSDAKAILRLSGKRVRDALAKGCPLDLHPRAFTLGDAATTQVALIPCQLWQLDEAPTFELSVPRSYAGSFWHWLASSAAEFGYEVRPALDGK
jgi:sarcosine oxidase subunit gamma